MGMALRYSQVKILETGDVDKFAKHLKIKERDVAEVAFHKARAMSAQVSKHRRLISIEWLRARNFSLYRGAPLPPEGELPC